MAMAMENSFVSMLKRLNCLQGGFAKERDTHNSSSSLSSSSFDCVPGCYIKINDQNHKPKKKVKGGEKEDANMKSPASSSDVHGGFNAWLSEFAEMNSTKRVVVLVDNTREANVALFWAFSHVVNVGDTVILLHIVQREDGHNDVDGDDKGSSPYPGGFKLRPGGPESGDQSPYEELTDAIEVVKSLEELCSSRWPEIDVFVEVVTPNGEKSKASVIVNNARRLEASILVLGQKKPSVFKRMFKRNYRKEETVQACIEKADCLVLGIRKQKNGMGGFIINSKWQKNFWLLA